MDLKTLGTIAAGLFCHITAEKCVLVANVGFFDLDLKNAKGLTIRGLCDNNGIGYWLLLIVIPMLFTILGVFKAEMDKRVRALTIFPILLALNITQGLFGPAAFLCSGIADMKFFLIFAYICLGIPAVVALLLAIFVLSL